MFQEFYGGVIAMKLRAEFVFLQYGMGSSRLPYSLNQKCLQWGVVKGHSLLIGWSSE